jgi:hypothetical protein
MELPLYCIIGERPVKAIQTEDGGLDVKALNWETGKFERDMKLLDRIYSDDTEVSIVDKAEFDRKVAEIRAEIE